MSDAVLVAVITAGTSVLCQLLINKKSRKDNAVAEAVKEQKLTDRLQTIETKLDIHNGYAEKLGAIEKAIAVIETEIKNIKN